MAVLDITVPLRILKMEQVRTQPLRHIIPWDEVLSVLLLLGLACVIRLLAAVLQPALEVDEPVYQSFALDVLRSGFPVLRPEVRHAGVPFLYNPPFYFFALAGWFQLWGSTSLFTGKLFNILCSLLLIGLLYGFARECGGKRVAFLAIILILSDSWIIFTNQSLWMDTSEMVFVVAAVWCLWKATTIPEQQLKRYVFWYTLTGISIGLAIVYKQTGIYLFPGIFLTLLILRPSWKGWILLFGGTSVVILIYMLCMYQIFGEIYITETTSQARRALGLQKSAGMNYGIMTALHALVTEYWTFAPTFFFTLLAIPIALWRCYQGIFRKMQRNHTVIIGWSTGAVISAVGLSIRGTNYFILWLIPLYLLLAFEGESLFYVHLSGTLSKQRFTRIIRVTSVLFLLLCSGSFALRFLIPQPADASMQVDTYIEKSIPSSAMVAAPYWVGNAIIQPYIDDEYGMTTPHAIYLSGADYLVIYWSVGYAIPSSFGNIPSYCRTLQVFVGVKDHTMICKLNRSYLASLYNSHPVIQKEQPVMRYHRTTRKK